MNWQPIETAPKDGSAFLGWLICAGMGQPETMRWNGVGPSLTNGSAVFHVSHWMPLPEPPQDEAA